jgi:TonB family protein
MMKRLRQRVGLSGAGIAMTFSLLGHASVAMLAIRHSRAATASPQLTSSALETLDVELESVEPNHDIRTQPTTVAMTVPAPSLTQHQSVVRSALPAAASGVEETAPEPGPAAAIVAENSDGPRFTMTVAPTIGSFGAPSASPGSGADGSRVKGPIPAASADIPARLRAGSLPAYTAAALSAGVEANVPLEIAVSEVGVVTSARGTEHVGYGLDEAARQGVLAYQFTPAVRSGKAIAVRMHWLMRFQLR